MSANHSSPAPMCTLTASPLASRRERLRSAIAMVLAAVCVAPAGRAQEDPWGDAQRASDPPRERASDPPRERVSDPPGESEPQRPDDSADDPDAQAEVEKSTAELEAVRKAEEKAGLLPRAPGAGPRDGISVGLDPADPVARDLSTALGTGLDGAPLADPAPAGSVSVKLPELLGISEEELRAKYDIPVELNDAVVAYIRFFQTDAREHFSKWLGRSTRYIPMMREVLERERIQLVRVLVREGRGTLAVRARHLQAVRPAHRFLGGRAARSLQGHGRCLALLEGPPGEVPRQLVSRLGRLQRRRGQDQPRHPQREDHRFLADDGQGQDAARGDQALRAQADRGGVDRQASGAVRVPRRLR